MNNNKLKRLIKTIGISTAAVLLSFNFAFASEITQENIVLLINRERRLNSLQPLTINIELDNAAYLKSKDMLNRNYFEHYGHGLSPWDFISNSGYEYIMAGENLAMDFQTAEGMVNAWLNSPAHRNNILNPEFRDMGIGVVKGEFKENNVSHSTIIVTNMFGREKPSFLKFIDNIRKSFLSMF